MLTRFRREDTGGLRVPHKEWSSRELHQGSASQPSFAILGLNQVNWEPDFANVKERNIYVGLLMKVFFLHSRKKLNTLCFTIF